MNLSWKDGMIGAVLYDENGKIIGEIVEEDSGGQSSVRRCTAIVRGEDLGQYVTREHARKAIEKAIKEIRA